MKRLSTEYKNRKEYFDSPEFREAYHCDAPLGSFCFGGGTVFRLWAPTAERVTLRLYREGAGGEPLWEPDLLPGERGLWTAEVAENLDGVYYDYLVTVDGVCRPTADPYARACGLNGERSMVIDLRGTDPAGWVEDRAPAKKPETVIYEVHVKDFSWDPASGVRPEWRGKFLALTQEGTTLNGDGLHPTCLDYLKDLRVTHIQLMPSFDYGSVDEGGAPDQFNWGYDPVNYNVPEGSYSTDPARGQVRIREMKEMVMALHRAGIRVVMDVVYNHTYRLDSWLWRTVPWYYCRQNEDGTPSNGSGCGCDLASERSMCAKYILDSVLYWAEEYHIDGFRFDLMGLLDVELMNRIRRALDRRFGRGEKLMLGEPWSAGGTAARPGTALCDKGHLWDLDSNVAAFCDNTRDAVKGDLSRPDARGFVNGGGLDAGRLACCVRGWAGSGLPHRAPSQTVSYLSAHDDWTLWDRLVCTGDRRRRFDARHPRLMRQNRLAAAINFTCQGHLFLLSGEEFARTKGGIKNTYCSPPDVNRMDWTRAWENRELVEYYKGLIALRMELPGLCDKSPQASERISNVRAPAPDCAAMEVDNTGGDSPWRRLFLAYNAGKTAVPLALPEGRWYLLADGKSSTKRRLKAVAGTVVLPPVSAMIFAQH